MGNPSTLIAHKERVEAETLSLINEVLDDCRKRKVTYDYLSHLAEYVAKQISRKRGKPFSQTTITRNPAYKRMLVLYMGTGAATKELTVSERKDLETQVYDLRLKLGNLQAENKRLRTYITTIEQGDAQTLLSVENNNNDRAYKEKCTSLVRLVRAVKEHLGEEFEWDESRATVIDMGTDKVIVEGEPVKTYFDWIQDTKKKHGNF